MKPNMYNDIPYNLVRKLIDAYEQKEKVKSTDTIYTVDVLSFGTYA